MFEELIKLVLGHLDENIQKDLLKNLEQVGKQIVADQVAKSSAHILLKGIDGVIAASVKTLGKGDAQKLMNAYTAEVQKQIEQLTAAIVAYAPLQLQVELAKATYGVNSKEASKARALRQVGIDEVKSEVQDAFRIVIGEDPKD